MHFKYFAHTVTEFLLPSVENTKKDQFDILMAITLGVNLVNKPIATFLSSTL